MILSAVTDEHRRAILHILHDASKQTLGYDTLVKRVAHRIQDDDRSPDSHRQPVRIAVYHTHLPKLQAAQLY